ncbi:MAG: MFS transporter [Clostridia bacterium]|nr:MFS transporter [Clostridia bacterium]
MDDNVKINWKVKFFYGMGDLSANILLAAFSFYLLFFMVSVGGLKPALASLVFLIAKIWDAVTDVWMGRISDNTKSRFGKRRVYMIFGAFPFGLMFIILWLCPFSVETSQFIKFVYYLMAYCLFNTTYTIVYVPYNSLTANITDDYDQRSSLTTVRIVLANVGLILGAALFGLFAGDNTVFSDLFIDAGYTRFEAIKYSYLVSSAIFGLLASVTMMISGIKVKEKYTGNEEKNPYGLLKTLSQFIKMKEFRYTTAYYLTSMLGFDIVLALFMFYIQDSLGYAPDGILSMAFVATPLLVAMATSVVWDKLSAKFEKHRVYLFSVIVTSIGLIIALLVPPFKGEMYQSSSASMGELLSSGTTIILTLAVFVVGCGMSGIQILPYASIPDIVELDEYTYGIRREGAYYGVQSFIYKLSNGVALALVSLLLQLFQYKETPFLDEGTGEVVYSFIQSQTAQYAVRIIFCVLPVAIFVVSIICAFKANMGRNRFNEIKEELAKRR